jgi:Putative Ig domain
VVEGTRVIVAPFVLTRAETSGAPHTSLNALSTGEWARLASTRLQAGAFAPIKAGGFSGHALIEIWLLNRRLATWRANAAGVVQGQARVPASAPAGTGALSIRSRGHKLNLTLTVTRRQTNPGNGIGAGEPSQPPPSTTGTSGAPAFVPGRTSPPSGATEGTAYTYTFAASGNPSPSFALAPGAPNWLRIGPQSGTVAGTPPVGSGGTSVSYSVIASNGSGSASAGPFTITIAWAKPTVGGIPDQTVPLQAPITPVQTGRYIAGDVTAFTATGLPPGLTIDPNSGEISGSVDQPTSTAHPYTPTVTVMGPGGSASTSFTWTVGDPVVDAVGDMGCALNDPHYNGGNGVASVPAPGNDCLQRYVSDLVVNPLPSGLFDLGDNQYDSGALSDYQHVFGSTFGRANAVTYPSLGNAEYSYETSASTPAAPTGFFDYFSMSGVFSRIQAKVQSPSGSGGGGDVTHMTSGGYYSFNIGTWHIIALNSNCSPDVPSGAGLSGGCGAGSPEELWLKNDLANTTQKCILAYWHHPRWNSGSLGNDSTTAAFWTDLYNAHATLVLNGHANHHYERFTPQNPSGVADPAGIREFIVSTGGQSHGVPPTTPGDQSTSQITNYNTFGILRLTLHPAGYDWQFVPATADGQPGTFTDSGSGACV